MTKLKKRIAAFVKLGNFLRDFSGKSIKSSEEMSLHQKFAIEFTKQIELARQANGWFTNENIMYAIDHWGTLLTEGNLIKWTQKYLIEPHTSKEVAIIMAGNIPLVGFHDLTCVLITGHHVLIKQSDSDKHILPVIVSFLQSVEPNFKDCIKFTNNQLKDFDAVIATGSDNTARYFDYYFRKKPHIIRKNRNSVAILTGNESKEELSGLGEDIFRYFGLGCRSVSKIFFPEEYDFDVFFNAIFERNEIINHHKYANNYDYNKAVYLMSLFKLKDNGFLMLKEDNAFASPIATVFYEHYTSDDSLKEYLKQYQDKIQCIVSSMPSKDHIPFGMSQKPELDAYADGIDTIDFLLTI
ncbi:acyl-CoA reductase [Ascidiimonas sp. W6]|uniref:acyl-CoA reductase n=1 Tax=Ascidiimonas meishanensis TaxID=3128903 RepID=UPI0030EB84C8